MPVAYALVLSTPSVRLPKDDLGLRRFETPDIASDVRLAQTFTMTADGLQAIEVFPAAPHGNVSGYVRLELHDITLDQGARVLHAAEVQAAHLVKTPSYRFEFPPILESKDRVYRLELVSSAAMPAEGVAFWATKGERYDGGELLINGAPRWADLAFRTHAPAPSIWRLLMTLRQTNPVRGHLVLVAFAVVWLLSGLVLRAIAGLADGFRSQRADSAA